MSDDCDQKNCAVTLVVLVLIASMVGVYYSLKKGSPVKETTTPRSIEPEKSVCDTAACDEIAKRYAASYDPTLDSCKSFYELACKYHTKPHAPKEIEMNNVKSLKEILDGRDTGGETWPIKVIRKFFTLYTSTDTRDHTDLTDLRRMIRNKIDSAKTIEDLLVFTTTMGVPFLFQFGHTFDFFRPKRLLLTISLVDTFPWASNETADKTLIKKMLLEYDPLEPLTIRPTRRSRRQAKMVKRTRRTTTKKISTSTTQRRKPTIPPPIDRVHNVYKVISDFRDFLKKENNTHTPDRVNMSTLLQMNAVVDLPEVVSRLRSESKASNPVDYVSIDNVKRINLFKNSSVQFLTYRDMVIVNTMLFYGEFFSRYFYNTHFEAISKLKWKERDERSRAVSILQEYAAIPLGALLIQEPYFETNLPTIRSLVEEIKSQLLEHLRAHPTSKVHLRGKNSVIERVERITMTIGYETNLLNSDLAELFPAMNSELMGRKLHEIVKTLIELKVKRLFKNVIDNRFEELFKQEYFNPARSTCLYVREVNHLFIPASLFKMPFYHPDFPRVIKYGALGVEVLAQLLHSIDLSSIVYNTLGHREILPSEKSVEPFNQYKHDAETVHNYYTNGSLDDNISLYSALRIAYKSYFSLGMANSALKNFAVKDPRHLFFYAFANCHCASTDDADGKLVKKNLIDTTLSSFANWREDFDCSNIARDPGIDIW